MSSSRRVSRSSSIGDNIGVFNSIQPIEYLPPVRKMNHRTPAKAQPKPSNPVQKPVEISSKKPPPEKPRRSVLTIGSPDRDGENYGSRWSKAEEKFGAFLEACFRCKKKFPEKEDIYMCGYTGFVHRLISAVEINGSTDFNGRDQPGAQNRPRKPKSHRAFKTTL